MTETYELLLPSPDRSGLLALGPAGRELLPSLTFEGERLQTVLETFARKLGLHAPFLRIAGRVGRAAGTALLCELDSPSPD